MLWPPSDSDTSWSPLSEADSPGTLSPLPSLALDDMDSSALPVSSGAMSGALSSGVLSSGALLSIDAQIQAWRMPSVEAVGGLRRDTVESKEAPPFTNSLSGDLPTPPPPPPTPWDVVLRACETTRALGYIPGTLFALIVLPHLLTFAMVCAAATVARRALGTARMVHLGPALICAFVVVYSVSQYNTRSDLADEMARNARVMLEIRRELAVIRAQLKEVNRECAAWPTPLRHALHTVSLDMQVYHTIKDVPRLKLLHALRKSHLWEGIADHELARLLQVHQDWSLCKVLERFPPGRVPDHECVDASRRGTVCAPRKPKKEGKE
ncbi:hypothetical protein CcaverHIS631_0703430 [Cutaneotrichosporon cavernicola]|nr:hypothetical protein CcaverHIS631_0703430 [Cutaneotrichosporon cavernicola]